MSDFGLYFVEHLLQGAGWPRRQGFRRRLSYDTAVLDIAIAQMIYWGVALGAGRPELALQVITEMFGNHDWSPDDTPTITAFIDDTGEAWGRAGGDPRVEIKPDPFLPIGKSIRADKLRDERTRDALEQWCVQGLIWGLAYPCSFATWYNSRIDRYYDMASLRDRNRLDFVPPPSQAQFYDDSASVLDGYQAEYGPLPTIPEWLLADARTLGREVGG